MEVTFRYTAADLQALAKRVPWHKRWADLFWVMFLLHLGMLAASILPAVFGFWIAMAICWTLLGIGVVIISVRVALTTPKMQIDPARIRAITLRLTDADWQTSSDMVHTKHDWSLIQRIEKTDERIFLFTEKLRAFVIPRAAFASDGEAAAFVQFAQQKSQSARPPAAENLPPWPLSEPDLLVGEDRDDVVRAQYTPSVKELLEFETHGVNPRQSGRISLVTMAIMAALILWVSLTDAQLAKVASCVVAGACSLGLAVFAYGRLRRWRWHRNLDPRRLMTTTLAASPRGVSLHSATVEGFVGWAAYTGLRQTAALFVLDGRKPNFEPLLIPRRAFASAADADRFVTLVNECVKPAETADFGGGLPVPKTAETGNPYQPPLHEH